ncbi:Avirulence (Avh) protein [Phytophthora megakarya]|uniref:Avirulence (Avh) protein n=1 Tax=Phytophthora megakarya TaxID=4795 RepID=A0A225VXN9_9STRA|nr:Avirulence (Avh) protein [Phytophthora megakarya]
MEGDSVERQNDGVSEIAHKGQDKSHEQEMEAPDYSTSELVRPLSNWEISRDHLVFADMCGLDTSKRHILHVIELSKEGEHGGVLLTVAGNTVQLLTMTPKVAADSSSVQHRRYLFGFGGNGIGSLAIHPSGEFFAVGEKGVKPNISIYRYPQLTVSHVLRNGTERAYASVEFSKNGETLASVGSAPDFLLTVWNWRDEQTVLRCKAFGQDVFSVRFAPTDSGFLATSGVGHIRLWKMAATFTGLKLQGDIGKFGKSELSDIEAFCVLPDKKVLSGTERGVLLLWDGNFIKCEILTSRRHLPHTGTINVVDYDEDDGHIVTAGKDGYVRFWSFDSIDSADVAADENVALVPMKRQVLVQPQMDIRAVVKEETGRYLLQDGVGGVHLLLLSGNDEHQIVLDYIPNDTGRATGLACSPYEHLAATSGEDGGVRAWDYVSGLCLMTVFPEQTFSDEQQNSSDHATLVAATTIAWVPNSVAVVNDHLPVSRQVAVGFDDGLVRVLLMDVVHRAWVLTNVFKPHSKRVTCMAYSHSGSFFVSASADGTFFLFQVVPSTKSSKFSKYQSEYEPYGFQRVAATVVAICWRDDDEAILITLANGQVVEFFLLNGEMNRTYGGGERADNSGEPVFAAKDTITERESYELLLPSREWMLHQRNRFMSVKFATKDTITERESYELLLLSREWMLHQRNRFMSVKELETLEVQYPNINTPQTEDKIRNQFQVEVRPGNGAVKALAALYGPKKDKGKPHSQGNKDCIYLSCQAPLDRNLFVAQNDQPTPLQELPSDITGHITSLELSTSKRFILCGLSNGKYQLRSAQRPHAFISGEFHDYVAVSSSNRLHLALSFDDSFVVAVGSDGNLSICRLYSDKVEEASKLLADKFENLLTEAAIARDQAREKQETVITLQQKAMDDKNEDDPSSVGGAPSTDLNTLPVFQGAKAYAAYVESKLSPSAATATDKEEFLGLIRIVCDTKNTDGLPYAPPIRDTGGPNLKTGVPAAALMQLGVADLANAKEAYTIEDAKLKSEADARARSTLSKQDSTRAVLSKMRIQLQELQEQDAALPSQIRVDPEEWEIDLDYGELMTRQGDEACDEVRKEMAFSMEKEELLLHKMRETYVGPLAVELLTLRAFESGLSVQSFRTMKMPPMLQKRLIEIHATEPATKKQLPAKIIGGPRRGSVLDILEKAAILNEEFPLKEDERRMIMSQTERAVDGKNGAAGWSPVMVGAHETGASKSVHGFEARKRLRTERKERLARWLSSKPGEDADDPRDVVAIAFAQRNMGDYKLKTAADYVVPEHQRVNAVKKLRQMALLEESLYAARLRFNAKVLELRELKVQLINELHRDQERLFELRAVLVANENGRAASLFARPTSLAVDLREWPEQRERVSDTDIELFLREKVISHLQTQTGDSHLSSTRTSGAEKHHESPDRSIAAVVRTLEGRGSTTIGTGALLTGVNIGHLHLQMDEGAAIASATAATISPSPTGTYSMEGNFDEDDVVVREYLMRQEALLLDRKQRREIVAFDVAVAHLRREKLTLEVGFKQAELRLFTLSSELSLLESFESKENLLSSKLEKSKGEKAQIVAELRDVQDLLTSKKRGLDEWSRQERAVQGEFLTLVNGGTGSSATPHPSLGALQKLFKRKIKRAKKRPTASGGKEDGKDGNGQPDTTRDGDDQEEEEEEEEDDDEDYDEDDDDDDEEEEDACPPGCDLTLYEKVLELREKRADVDDAVGELHKAIEELRKAGERQAAKQRSIDKELTATEQDTQQFQSEKQSRFNQLDVVVPLSTRQLRCLEVPSPNQQNWLMPAQAGGCLVFPMRAFSALTERIESLQTENKQLRQQFRDLHKQQNVLAREKRHQQESIARAQDRSEQLMRLKFGQLVDLEVLDRACDASPVDELQTCVKLREVEGVRTLRRVKQTHPQLQHAILQATEQNTTLLAQITALTERHAELERELNRNQGSGSGSDGGGFLSLDDDEALAEREMKERNKLVRLVKLQVREVEALKQEIGLLRGKDGKVYAPRKMATRAKKRQRAHRHKPDLEQEEDYLLHMDPSLMTERQQLAFLLRTTAHEASDASHSGDESSEDEMSLHPTKKPRRIVRAVRVEHPTTATTPTRRGPGRSLKNKKSPRAADGNLRVMMQKSKGQHDKRLETKPSPSGSDDIAHLDTARTFGQRMPRCALCCDYDTVYEASFSDALFLCPTCDHKYPTQHALGRRACMT